MAKAVTEARRPDATAGTDAIYRSLFDSFNPDSDGRISPLEVLSGLERCGLRPDDPRIAEALTGLAGADGGSRQISFAQFKALAQHNSSLIRRAVEGNLGGARLRRADRRHHPDVRRAAAGQVRLGGRLHPAAGPG
jgi:EF-hand domain